MKIIVRIVIVIIVVLSMVKGLSADKSTKITLNYEKNDFRFVVLYDIQSQRVDRDKRALQRYQKVIKYIDQYAKRYDVNPLVPACIFRVESDYRNVIGDDGKSFGIAQLNISTIETYKDQFKPWMVKSNIQENIAEGIYHIAWLSRYGNMAKVIVAYNAGEGYIIGRSERQLKKNRYYRKVMHCIYYGELL